MSEVKRFYWLKLKRDFFKRHDIMVIESMPNGKEYVLFYLKLMAESIDHEGMLRFNDTIPYNEDMLSTITNTNVDIVRNALKLLHGLGMVEVLSDQTIYVREVKKMIGSETNYAEKMRESRARKKLPEGEGVTMLPPEGNNVNQSKSKSIDIEKDLDIEEIKKERKKKESAPEKTLEAIEARMMEGTATQEDFEVYRNAWRCNA